MGEVARNAGILKHSSVNGPGVRYVVFLQGCPHHCPACHNPETHEPDAGSIGFCNTESSESHLIVPDIPDGAYKLLEQIDVLVDGRYEDTLTYY